MGNVQGSQSNTLCPPTHPTMNTRGKRRNIVNNDEWLSDMVDYTREVDRDMAANVTV